MNLKKFPLDELTAQLADDLSRYAERPVHITVKAAGPDGKSDKTFGEKPNSRTLHVEMDTAILTRIRNKRPGEKIWRGIAYYRVLNQLTPATAQLTSATKAGYASLFSIVNDEHNERRATAKDRKLGSVFQTLCACVYRADQSKRTDAPVVGVSGGSKEEGFARNPQYVFRLNQFAYYLRRGLTPEDGTDACVLEALALVPENLKELDKDQVLELTGSIHSVLSRGVKLPKAASPKAAAQAAAVVDIDDLDLDENEDDAEEAPLELVQPTDPKWWSRLFSSKWSYITLGSFVFLWLVLLMRIGIGLWTALAASIIILAIGGSAIGIAALFSYRSERSKRKEKEGDTKDKESGGFHLSMTLPPLLRNKWFYICAAAGIGFVALETMLSFWPAVILAVVAGLFLSGLVSVKVRFTRRVRNPDGSWSEVDTSLLRELCSLPHRIWRGFVENVLVPLKDCAVNSWAAFIQRSGELIDNIKVKWEDARKSETSNHICSGFRQLWEGGSRWALRTLYLLWRSSTFRLFVVALPIAMLVMLLYAFVLIGSELVLWQLVLFGALWLVVMALGYIFRMQIRQWVIAEVHTEQEVDHTIDTRLPVDKHTTGFDQIAHVEPVDADPEMLNRVFETVNRVAEPLRESLRKLGFVVRDRDNMDEGYDLIDELEQVALGETDIFVGEKEKAKTSLALHVLIDCSTSQQDPTSTLAQGEKFLRSKVMGLAIEEAVRGKRGVSAHFWGFNDSTVFDCGEAGLGRLSGLKVMGGNNDAAALYHVAQNAASDRALTVIILISDGQPSECSWGALHSVGWDLMRNGIAVVQMSTDRCDDPALPWHHVDLCNQSLTDASTFLGNVLETRVAGR